ncbi:Uncharacterised protein [uncultured archaeon]|nr:Uncharacterised protein [uncultured archaeon]
MEPVNWKELLQKLVAEASVLRGERMQAQVLKQTVAHALQQAESESADAKIVGRLDLLLMELTEVTKENVCTNTKCPHYSKRCKMR